MHGCMDAWMHGCVDAWMLVLLVLRGVAEASPPRKISIEYNVNVKNELRAVGTTPSCLMLDHT